MNELTDQQRRHLLIERSEELHDLLREAWSDLENCPEWQIDQAQEYYDQLQYEMNAVYDEIERLAESGDK